MCAKFDVIRLENDCPEIVFVSSVLQLLLLPRNLIIIC